MRNIFFYPRSRNITPHIDEKGTVHVPVSMWPMIDRLDRFDERQECPRNRSSDGTSQPSQ